MAAYQKEDEKWYFDSENGYGTFGPYETLDEAEHEESSADAQGY